jgi:hypothetical protein
MSVLRAKAAGSIVPVLQVVDGAVVNKRDEVGRQG